MTGEPVFASIKKWRRAIPQYNIGYETVANAIENFKTANRGVFFCSNFYKGISVGDCVKNGLRQLEKSSSFEALDKFMSKFQLQPGFPTTRFRRLRRTPALREMFRETTLSVSDFIYPLFIVEGENVRNEISSMPGQYQLSVDQAVGECEQLLKLGIKSVILFGIPNDKDEVGSGALCRTME